MEKPTSIALKTAASGFAAWVTNYDRITQGTHAVKAALNGLARLISGSFKGALFVGKHALAGLASGLARASLLSTFGFSGAIGSTVFGLRRFVGGCVTPLVDGKSLASRQRVPIVINGTCADNRRAWVDRGRNVQFHQLSQSGFGLASQVEQATVAFTTMIGSADKAKASMNEIAEFSAKTPFQFPDLIEMGRTLLAANTSAEQLVPTMRVVGDIAAGSNTPLNEMAEIYTKIKLQGKAGLRKSSRLPAEAFQSSKNSKRSRARTQPSFAR